MRGVRASHLFDQSNYTVRLAYVAADVAMGLVNGEMLKSIGRFMYRCVGVIIMLVIAIPIAAVITPFIVIGPLEEIFNDC